LKTKEENWAEIDGGKKTKSTGKSKATEKPTSTANRGSVFNESDGLARSGGGRHKGPTKSPKK